jgi:hypothetical protein
MRAHKQASLFIPKEELSMTTAYMNPELTNEHEESASAFQFELAIELGISDLYLQNSDPAGEPDVLGKINTMDLYAEVPIPDGIYVVREEEFHIQNQRLINRWMTPDESQMSLFEEVA